MERKAVKVEKGVVTNVIIIDDNTPEELYDLEISPDTNVGIGWKYAGGEFVAPKAPKPKNSDV